MLALTFVLSDHGWYGKPYGLCSHGRGAATL